MIEQGGSSLYSTLALQVTDVEVLRIVVSIGGTEVDHFGVWQDTAANAVEPPLAGVKDPKTGTFFPNLKKQDHATTRPNNIFPRPCEFINQRPARLLDRPPDAIPERGRHGGGQVPHRDRAVQGPVERVLHRGDGARSGR